MATATIFGTQAEVQANGMLSIAPSQASNQTGQPAYFRLKSSGTTTRAPKGIARFKLLNAAGGVIQDLTWPIVGGEVTLGFILAQEPQFAPAALAHIDVAGTLSGLFLECVVQDQSDPYNIINIVALRLDLDGAGAAAIDVPVSVTP